jgi:oligopeptide/dipeptide ABC transporter ATP-binding protein
MMPLLEIKNLNAGYISNEKKVRAVRDVSLNLEEGEFLGLAGESGCGKSTLAYAVSGLLNYPGRVFDGQVSFNGEDLLIMSPSELRERRWRDFSVVMQASMSVLNPVMKIRDQFYDTMRAHLKGNDKNFFEERTREMFELVNISPEYLDAYPHQLSGGMKQRVVIAIALSLRPKLVIMDEPTTALDVVVQRGILQQIDKLRKELGFSIIFITHDLSLLVEIADSIAIMYAGKIIEKTGAAEIYSNPLHPYTHGLMNSFPPLVGKRKRLHGIAGHPPDLSLELLGCPYYERCEKSYEGLCDKKMPDFKEVEANHHVACQLYSERGAEDAG